MFKPGPQPTIEKHLDKEFRLAPYGRSHYEPSDAIQHTAEAICYARTWWSQCYCKFRDSTSGFQCSGKPHEFFDKERRKLPFGARIPKTFIALGKRPYHTGFWWGWSDKPWIWE